MIERLTADDGLRLREIRLRALQDAPEAFATTYEEAAARAAESWDRQLEQLPTFIARLAGRDVGIVRGAPHNERSDTGYLISMWVSPEARRQRIGSALVDAVVNWAKNQSYQRLLLDVAEGNASAIAFYERTGFVPTGEFGTLPPPREHIREIQMVRLL